MNNKEIKNNVAKGCLTQKQNCTEMYVRQFPFKLVLISHYTPSMIS